jgi:hypothetical protein
MAVCRDTPSSPHQKAPPRMALNWPGATAGGLAAWVAVCDDKLDLDQVRHLWLGTDRPAIGSADPMG